MRAGKHVGRTSVHRKRVGFGRFRCFQIVYVALGSTVLLLICRGLLYRSAEFGCEDTPDSSPDGQQHGITVFSTPTLLQYYVQVESDSRNIVQKATVKTASSAIKMPSRNLETKALTVTPKVARTTKKQMSSTTTTVAITKGAKISTKIISTKKTNIGNTELVYASYKNGTGRPFTSITTDILHYYHLLLNAPASRNFSIGRSFVKSDVVFVTASTDNHFKEVINLISSIHRCLPSNKVMLYDLGLSSEYRQRLSKLCNVEIRYFNATKYPVYVNFIEEKRWKPIVVHEVLTENRVVFWVDASIRFNCGQYSDVNPNPSASENYTRGGAVKFEQFWKRTIEVASNSELVLFSRTPHMNYPVIHERMYEFLPTDEAAMQRTRQYQSGLILFRRSRELMLDIVRYWVYCALELHCQHPKSVPANQHDSPQLWHHCHSLNESRSRAGCHRQDQSSINILALNKFRYDIASFTNLQRHTSLSSPLMVSRFRETEDPYLLRCGGASSSGPQR